MAESMFYSHVNYSVTKITVANINTYDQFYSHVNYSVTKMRIKFFKARLSFYSHVNYSVTKIFSTSHIVPISFTVT